jgi:hypothetical protein
LRRYYDSEQLAMVGDGHTRVNATPGMFRVFPMGVVEIEGVHRIVRGAGPAAELVGGRLTKIGDMPLAEAVARIRTIIHQAESEVLIASRTPQWFAVAEALHGLGMSAETARFTAVMDDGTERTAELRALDASVRPEWRLAARSQPLYRQRMGEGFWFEWLTGGGDYHVGRNYLVDELARRPKLRGYVITGAASATRTRASRRSWCGR